MSITFLQKVLPPSQGPTTPRKETSVDHLIVWVWSFFLTSLAHLMPVAYNVVAAPIVAVVLWRVLVGSATAFFPPVTS
jgi:hypothetical protein